MILVGGILRVLGLFKHSFWQKYARCAMCGTLCVFSMASLVNNTRYLNGTVQQASAYAGYLVCLIHMFTIKLHGQIYCTTEG